MTGNRTDILREVTGETRTQVRALIDGARHAALACLEPQSGDPLVSRVGLATLEDGTPLIFISALAAHSSALGADSRCALLIGEPGKGDPLAHPRLSVKCLAKMIAPESPEALAARNRYSAAHPKAGLYLDLPDFRFFRLDPVSASFNGGFGRAFALSPADILAR